jgi:transcriptional regulator with XRE-family HTH domain
MKKQMNTVDETDSWAMPSARVEVLRILLIERRRQANLTQVQLAEKLGEGWHQSTIASIESGARKVDLLEFLKIAEALAFDPADFLKTLSTVRDD